MPPEKIKLPSLGKSKSSFEATRESHSVFVFSINLVSKTLAFCLSQKKTAVQAVFYLRTNKLSLHPS